MVQNGRREPAAAGTPAKSRRQGAGAPARDRGSMALVGAVGAAGPLAVDPFAGRGLTGHSVSPAKGCRAGLKGRKGDRGSLESQPEDFKA